MPEVAATDAAVTAEASVAAAQPAVTTSTPTPEVSTAPITTATAAAASAAAVTSTTTTTTSEATPALSTAAEAAAAPSTAPAAVAAATTTAEAPATPAATPEATAAAAPDPTLHVCYLCEYEEPKDKYTNKQLSLKGQEADGSATTFRPTLHYNRRRFRKAGRELQFLEDSEWVWPWTKGVTTEYSVQFITLDDPRTCSANPRVVCGTCIREKHADAWKKITDYNHNYI